MRIVTTSRRGWRVGIDAEQDNPYEGATLKPALAQVRRVTGVRPKEAFVDKGFRGQHDHPKAGAVYIAGRRNLAPQLSRLLKRRSAIEPVLGHTKHDHGRNRNYLLGNIGDRINAMLSGCAWNLKKLWRYFVEHPLPVPVPCLFQGRLANLMGLTQLDSTSSSFGNQATQSYGARREERAEG